MECSSYINKAILNIKSRPKLDEWAYKGHVQMGSARPESEKKKKFEYFCTSIKEC